MSVCRLSKPFKQLVESLNAVPGPVIEFQTIINIGHFLLIWASEYVEEILTVSDSETLSLTRRCLSGYLPQSLVSFNNGNANLTLPSDFVPTFSLSFIINVVLLYLAAEQDRSGGGRGKEEGEHGTRRLD